MSKEPREQGAETLPPLTDEQIIEVVKSRFARAAIAASGSAPVAEDMKPTNTKGTT
jgi:hypothetical protein